MPPEDPSQPDLSAWRELRRVSTAPLPNSVHCYLLWDEASRDAALIDLGPDLTPILSLVEQNQLALKHLFLTHAPEDGYLAALESLRKAFPGLRLHTSNPAAPPQHRNRANECVQVGSLRISHRDTPGHAADEVIYVAGNWPEDAPHVAFVGDIFFAGSLATGLDSLEQLKRSVREKIFTLPDDTLICPGHGPLTTVAREKRQNPFFA